MSDAVFFALGIFLMVFGAVAAVYCLLLRLLSPRKRGVCCCLLWLRDDNDPSSVISYALEKRSLLGECSHCKILAVDCGLSEENRRFLDSMYGGNAMFAIVSRTEALRLLSTMGDTPDRQDAPSGHLPERHNDR